MHARSALFTLFGDVVRPAGGEAWLGVLTECMGTLGFTPEATRTALHRMTAEGWVEPRREGRYAAYRLTARGVDRLAEAAARIYRLRAEAWDGRWRLLISSSAGDSAELAPALHWQGFGRLTRDTWISPHEHGARLDALLRAHGLDQSAIRFSTQPATGPSAQDPRIVRAAWDLDELQAAHTAFLERWSTQTPPDDPRAALGLRLALVHHWRSFLFLDPGLPLALLPGDWSGTAAAAAFRDLYEAVSPAAWRWYDDLVGDAALAQGLALPDPVHHEDDSPFARGLAALETTWSA